MHAQRLMQIAAVAGVATATLVPAAATAGPIYPGGSNASPSPDGNGVDLTAVTGSGGPLVRSPSPVRSRPRPSPVSCVDTPLASAGDPSIPDPALAGGVTSAGVVIAPGTPGRWVLFECTDSSGSFVPGGFGVTFIPARSAPSAAGLAAVARRHVPLPAPNVVLSPPASGWQYVNIPTWAWVPASEWAPVSATVSVAGVSVSATAVPDHITFRFDDGRGGRDTVVCKGPGTPYDSTHPPASVTTPSPDCGYTWRHSAAGSADERLGVEAVVSYHVTWTAAGVAGGGDFGLLDSAPYRTRVTVGQVEAVVTDGH